MKPRTIRGINDLLPDNLGTWKYLEEKVIQIVESYGFNEIRLPIMERMELFKRSIGEGTDIVEKEMYTFNDRNEDESTRHLLFRQLQNQHHLLILQDQSYPIFYSG